MKLLAAVTVPSVKPRKKRWPRVVGIIVLIIVLLIACAGGYVYWLVNKSLPVIKGELQISGLEKEVTVWRDESGVPHIEAQSEQDLYIAQGYVTAQDRIFQMDLSRRQASGQLSEVVGAKAIDRDKFFRSFGLRRAAEASLAAYSEESKNVLEWYAQGVNNYIKQAKESKSLPIEFTILGYQPTEWQPIDSLTIGKYMAYDLAGNWEGQAFRYSMAQKLSPEKLQSLMPTYPKDGATIIQALKDNPVDLTALAAAAVTPDPFNGSNNWVVSGEKSASGKPMLANDPHLGLDAPSIWYETHLSAPDLNVSGVIFAGVPGIILGHNEDIAWGVTNLGPDVQDLYIEKRNPENPNQFEYMGKWEAAKVYKEEIKIKGEEPVSYDVVVTRHGPIISEFAKDQQQDTALAMRWTALDSTTELEAIQMFAKAHNWEEFKKSLEFFDAPAQNFVFASTDGTIAYRGNGLIPIRKKGDGSVPVPGWTDEYEWTGYIPWDDLPTTVNPKEGFIATANNKVIDDSYPFHLTDSWAQPYREARIQQVLSGKDKLTVEDMQKLQFDRNNLQAEEFLDGLIGKVKNNSDLRPVDKEVLGLLQNWNKVNDPDQAAPLAYELWMQKFDDVLFKPEISDDMMKLFNNKAIVKDEMLRKSLQGEQEPWVDEKGGLEKVALQALQLAVDQAVTLQGKHPSKWQWGEFHQVDFPHPLGSVKPLNLIFNAKAVPMGGGRVTVGAAGWDSATGEVNHGAPWRTVIDLSDPLRSFNVVGPGQSGHLLSKWYHNQVDDWTTGQYHMTSIVPAIYRNAGNELKLIPE
ncbi:penicillin acylase family protein [Paenibacillus dokdonensis]|uniref:Penicillin acylase family protein n=1 Tax=Paenibacillus dokdonensis TaxID=2567944 RepID=A0ABU6GKU3_9BACL|nr:penicillin acylase family protein [Paenibacillus dokdonensis]MEC0238856.1 penicillin acylase family protein [Paenibacillus dokdonensis]